MVVTLSMACDHAGSALRRPNFCSGSGSGRRCALALTPNQRLLWGRVSSCSYEKNLPSFMLSVRRGWTQAHLRFRRMSCQRCVETFQRMVWALCLLKSQRHSARAHTEMSSSMIMMSFRAEGEQVLYFVPCRCWPRLMAGSRQTCWALSWRRKSTTRSRRILTCERKQFCGP